MATCQALRASLGYARRRATRRRSRHFSIADRGFNRLAHRRRVSERHRQQRPEVREDSSDTLLLTRSVATVMMPTALAWRGVVALRADGRKPAERGLGRR